DPSIDVCDALTAALAGMPPLPDARWEAVARTLIIGGCPVLGSAGADAFVDDQATLRRLHAAAAGEQPGTGSKHDHSAPTITPGTAADLGADADRIPTTPSAVVETGYSCAALCDLHMVDLCNNDRTLWSRHGSRWENTRCGVRRSEGFLEDCYRMQWLS